MCYQYFSFYFFFNETQYCRHKNKIFIVFFFFRDTVNKIIQPLDLITHMMSRKNHIQGILTITMNMRLLDLALSRPLVTDHNESDKRSRLFKRCVEKKRKK